MSSKKDITETLKWMGFPPHDILRAFKVFEKKYGHKYNVDTVIEIIIGLQNKDKAKEFNIGDQVIYGTQMAEIMDKLNCGKIEITYPTNINVMRRKKCIVSPQQLKVLHYICI